MDLEALLELHQLTVFCFWRCSLLVTHDSNTAVVARLCLESFFPVEMMVPVAANTAAAAAAAFLLLPSAVQAWGAMGHETVAYVATDFVAADTRAYFQDLLADASADYLASVAAWADPYGHTEAGNFSSGFHYIDAQDSPPSSCGVDLARDCGEGGCIVTAISNYVSR